jgi:hypothetical protein
MEIEQKPKSRKELDEEARAQRKAQLEEYNRILEETETGSVHDIRVDASEELEQWVYYDNILTGPKKYLLKYIRIPYEEHLNVTMRAWEKAKQDPKMFTLLFQVEHMKRTWVSLGGIKCDSKFWVEVNPDLIDVARSMLYPPDDLQPKVDSEQLKNLLTGLQPLLESMLSGVQLPTPSLLEKEDLQSLPVK